MIICHAVIILKLFLGTSLVVQWLRLQAPNAGGPGSITSQGTRSHRPKLKKVPVRCNEDVATKTQHSQKKKLK